MKRFHLTAIAFLTALLVSGAANALTCQTDDPATLQHLWGIEEVMGKQPKLAKGNLQCSRNTNLCTGDGIASGPTTISCEPAGSPNCKPKLSRTIHYAGIDYVVDLNEFISTYHRNQIAVLRACFLQLGPNIGL